jgi:hypothetical protein
MKFKNMPARILNKMIQHTGVMPAPNLFYAGTNYENRATIAQA